MNLTPSVRKPIFNDAQLKTVITELEQIIQDIPCPLIETLLRVGEQPTLPLLIANRSGPFKNAASEQGKTRLFRIASLGKLLINLAFCVYLVDENKTPGTDFKSDAFETYESQLKLGEDMEILELLLHTKGFVEMNHELLGPEGTFMFSSAQDLINVAISLSNTKSWNYEYSAVNHIFAAEILQKLTKKTIHEIIDTYVVKKFGLKYTTLNKEQLEKWVASDQVLLIPGYQGTADLRDVIPVPEEFKFCYMSNSLEQAFLGCWSNVEDLDKLFNELFRAYHQEDNSKISFKAAKQFFAWEKHNEDNTEQHALAGICCPLESSHDARESPNSFLLERDSTPIYKLGKPAGSLTAAELTYKGAATTGYTASLYFDLKERIFLVVLGNMSGPVDLTPIAAHVILQRALFLLPLVNIPEAVRNNMDRLLTLPIQLETEERDAASWPSTNFRDFVGTYKSRIANRIMVVTDTQKVILRRGSISTEAMTFRTNDDEKIMRIFPGRQRYTVDRLGCWRDLTFKLVNDGGNITLIRGNGAERYVKQ